MVFFSAGVLPDDLGLYCIVRLLASTVRYNTNAAQQLLSKLSGSCRSALGHAQGCGKRRETSGELHWPIRARPRNAARSSAWAGSARHPWPASGPGQRCRVQREPLRLLRLVFDDDDEHDRNRGKIASILSRKKIPDRDERRTAPTNLAISSLSPPALFFRIHRRQPADRVADEPNERSPLPTDQTKHQTSVLLLLARHGLPSRVVQQVAADQALPV